MNIQFATRDRRRALEFLNTMYDREILDTPDDAGPLLDMVEQDLARVQDPMMYGDTIQIVPGKNFTEDRREELTLVSRAFNDNAVTPNAPESCLEKDPGAYRQLVDASTCRTYRGCAGGQSNTHSE